MNAICERDEMQSGRKPRGKVRKPFAVEYRYSPAFVAELRREQPGLGWLFRDSEIWTVWRRYSTERDRDRALDGLQRKNAAVGGKVRREFRKGNQ